MTAIFKTVDYNGAIVFWLPGDQNLQKTSQGMESLGLKHYTPSPRTQADGVANALREVFKDQRFLIRPLNQEGHYVVNEEQRGENSNTYKPVYGGWVKKGIVEFPAYNRNAQVDCQNAYMRLMGTCPSHHVTRALVGLTLSHLKGTTLKESGGVYWIPQGHVDTWTKVGEVYQGAGRSRIYTIRSVADADTARAIVETFTSELTDEIAALNLEVMGDETPGTRRLNTIAKKAKAMLDKVRVYEASTDNELVKLRKLCEHLAETATGAALLASARDD